MPTHVCLKSLYLVNSFSKQTRNVQIRKNLYKEKRLSAQLHETCRMCYILLNPDFSRNICIFYENQNCNSFEFKSTVCDCFCSCLFSVLVACCLPMNQKYTEEYLLFFKIYYKIKFHIED